MQRQIMLEYPKKRKCSAMNDLDYECPPVMICGFNRPDCLAQVFSAVREARPKQLFLVLDAPRVDRPDDIPGYEACKKVFDDVDWPCDVKRNYAEHNMGCGGRMTSGITWVFEHVDRAILFEDDCVPEVTFFPFCAELLERYKDDTRVGMIAGHDEHFHLDRIDTYGDSYYFDRMASIWGWATWRRAWKKHDPDMPDWPFMSSSGVMKNVLPCKHHVRGWIDFTGKLYSKERNLWAAAWAYTMYKEHWLSVHPVLNQICNVGTSSSRAECAPKVGCQPRPRTGKGWYNRPTYKMVFPLKHPLTMLPNLKSEYYFQEDVQTPAAWRRWLRLPARITARLKRIAGQIKKVENK